MQVDIFALVQCQIDNHDTRKGYLLLAATLGRYILSSIEVEERTH